MFDLEADDRRQCSSNLKMSRALNPDECNPEVQNAINSTIDTSERQVIASFIKRPQESAAALVNTFTYLTMGKPLSYQVLLLLHLPVLQEQHPK